MNNKKIDQILREKKIKPTTQRIAILELLFSSKRHPTVEDIYKKIIISHPTISIATIYKTVNLFVSKNIIREFEIGDKKAHYEPNLEPHINLICEQCGLIEDLNTLEMDKFIQSIQNSIETVITQQRMDFYTICKNCQIKQHV